MLKPRIAILHAHNTLNYGNMMMCENAIYYLSKFLRNASFVVPSDYVKETEDRLKEATGCNNILVRPRTISSPILNKFPNRMSSIFNQMLFRYRKMTKVLAGCNVVIILGGDDISEYYGVMRLMDILLRLWYLKKAHKRIYLLGQTIGPLNSCMIPLARAVLGKMDRIYHRGPLSYNYVTNVLGVKGNSFLSSDLAFLDLARQNGNYNIKRFNLHCKEYVTFVPSGFWSSYCRDYKTYFDGLLHMKNYLLKKCEERHLKLLLLPHVLRTSDDRTMVSQMMAAGKKSRNIIGITDLLLPFEAREILGKSYFVVSQRMHGAISSFQKGIPAFCLSYSVKFSEVIGNYLGCPELVTRIRKANFRKDLDKACSNMDLILKDMASLKVKIGKTVSRAKRDAMIQLEDIAKDILS